MFLAPQYGVSVFIFLFYKGSLKVSIPYSRRHLKFCLERNRCLISTWATENDAVAKMMLQLHFSLKFLKLRSLYWHYLLLLITKCLRANSHHLTIPLEGRIVYQFFSKKISQTIHYTFQRKEYQNSEIQCTDSTIPSFQVNFQFNTMWLYHIKYGLSWVAINCLAFKIRLVYHNTHSFLGAF